MYKILHEIKMVTWYKKGHNETQIFYLEPVLLTWFNFNPIMDK